MKNGLCIYCGENEATERYCGVGCGCSETPADMDLEASASVGAGPARPDGTRVAARDDARNGAIVWFAIGNVAEHSGFVTSRRTDDAWSSANESGWTYQEVCGAHGTVLHEGASEDEARKILDAWLVCDAAEKGTYCCAHNPAVASCSS